MIINFLLFPCNIDISFGSYRLFVVMFIVNKNTTQFSFHRQHYCSFDSINFNIFLLLCGKFIPSKLKLGFENFSFQNVDPKTPSFPVIRTTAGSLVAFYIILHKY